MRSWGRSRCCRPRGPRGPWTSRGSRTCATCSWTARSGASGLAAELLRPRSRTPAGAGFGAVRLFVAEGQARARRFYEREGWRAVTEPYFDAKPGLSMIEYRLALD